MEERGAGGDSNPVDSSERPAAGASASASTGKSSQERTSSSSYYDRKKPNASNNSDGSHNEEIVKVWSQKAAGWRCVTAKYIETQIEKGEASYHDERAWVMYKKIFGMDQT